MAVFLLPETSETITTFSYKLSCKKVWTLRHWSEGFYSEVSFFLSNRKEYLDMTYFSLSDFQLWCSLLKLSTFLKPKYMVMIPQIRKDEPTMPCPQSSTVNATQNALVSPGEPPPYPLSDSFHAQHFLLPLGLTSGRPLICARDTSK